MKQYKRFWVGVAAAAAGALGFAAAANAADVITGTMTADNAFFAYISQDDTVLGTLIGSGNDWGTAFNINPTVLQPGDDFLHVEVVNYGGPAGFTAKLNFSDGGTSTTLNAEQWEGIYNDDNADPNAPQPWVQPDHGSLSELNVAWGDTLGIDPADPNAKVWIWPVDPQSATDQYNPCQTCTVDFSLHLNGDFVGSPTPEPATWGLMVAGFGGLGASLRLRRKAAIVA